MKKEFLKKLIVIFMDLIAIVLIFAVAFLSGKFLGITIVQLRNGDLVNHLDDYSQYELPTTVYDINGEKITEFTAMNRQLVSFKDIPHDLIHAFVYAEDERFYQHYGLDSYSIARAFVHNIKALKIVEGGSTITQQLAKLFFTKKEKTLKRKILELWYALHLEKRYTKQELLEKYLNKIFFGHGVWGVKSASQYFYGKNVKNLTAAECAMLAIIPPAPSKISPFNRPITTRIKQSRVLRKMILGNKISSQKANQSYITFWQNIKKRWINNHDALIAQYYRKDKAPYFSEYVRLLAEKCLSEELGISKDALYRKGLKIYTSLDLKKQHKARYYLQSQLKKQDHLLYPELTEDHKELKEKYTDLFNFIGLSHLDSGYHYRYKQEQLQMATALNEEADIMDLLGSIFAINELNSMLKHRDNHFQERVLSDKPEGAIISIEPKNGRISAMVGGRRFASDNQFNRAIYAKRQPGSTFKAFLYGSALHYKIAHPSTIVGYKRTGSATYHQPITLKQALQYSLNSVAASLIDHLGYEKVIDFAAPLLGITRDRFPSDPSIALGTGEITPLELCRGMAVFANEGKEVVPIAILRIVDRNGKVIKNFEQEIGHKKRQLISSDLANLMTEILSTVIKPGGTAAWAVKEAGFDRPAAGKTGSTQFYKDAWFVGYTPNLVTAVWIGFDNSQSLGNKQFGGNVAAPVWAKFMKDVHQHLPIQDFNKPKKLPPFVKVANWEKTSKEVEEYEDDFYYNIYLNDEKQRGFYLASNYFEKMRKKKQNVVDDDPEANNKIVKKLKHTKKTIKTARIAKARKSDETTDYESTSDKEINTTQQAKDKEARAKETEEAEINLAQTQPRQKAKYPKRNPTRDRRGVNKLFVEKKKDSSRYISYHSYINHDIRDQSIRNLFIERKKTNP